jgi:hypothetical protein
MLSITLSNFEDLHEVLHTMSAITNFRKNSFIFIFGDNGVVTKSFEVGCTFEEVAKKTKCQKMSVNFLQPNYNESFHLVYKGQITLKLLYSIINFNTISLPY